MADRSFAPSRVLLFALVATIVLLMSLTSVSSETNNTDFSSALFLGSGVEHEGTIDTDDQYFKVEPAYGDAIEFQFKDPDGQDLKFCVYEGNKSSDEIDCVYPARSPGVYYQKATKDSYFVRIICGECTVTTSGQARFSIEAIHHLDEAGDTLDEQVLLMPEVMIHGSLFGTDADFFNIPVMCGDGNIRFVITDENTGGMTSYRLYDHYGIKISEHYESAPYDFVSGTSDCPPDSNYPVNFSVELLCAFEGHCDYSLIAIGSTWEPLEPSSSGGEGNASGISLSETEITIVVVIVVFIGLLMSLKIFGGNRANLESASDVIPNEGLGESILTTGIASPPATDESPISQSREIQTSVQMQDSVHQGDVVGGDKISTKVVNEPEVFA